MRVHHRAKAARPENNVPKSDITKTPKRTGYRTDAHEPYTWNQHRCSWQFGRERPTMQQQKNLVMVKDEMLDDLVPARGAQILCVVGRVRQCNDLMNFITPACCCLYTGTSVPDVSATLTTYSQPSCNLDILTSISSYLVHLSVILFWSLAEPWTRARRISMI